MEDHGELWRIFRSRASTPRPLLSGPRRS